MTDDLPCESMNDAIARARDAISTRDAERGFCSRCGASIPHRPGEGRCTFCAHHRPADEVVPPWELKVDL